MTRTRSRVNDEYTRVLVVSVPRDLDALMLPRALSEELAANDNARECVDDHRAEGFKLRGTQRTDEELVFRFERLG